MRSMQRRQAVPRALEIREFGIRGSLQPYGGYAYRKSEDTISQVLDTFTRARAAHAAILPLNPPRRGPPKLPPMLNQRVFHGRQSPRTRSQGRTRSTSVPRRRQWVGSSDSNDSFIAQERRGARPFLSLNPPFLFLVPPRAARVRVRSTAFGRAFNRAFERGLRSARDDIATNASRCSINGRDMNGRVNGACTK